ncbi:hypothetical protein ACFE04_010838 [Oxalis oulophora]
MAIKPFSLTIKSLTFLYPKPKMLNLFQTQTQTTTSTSTSTTTITTSLSLFSKPLKPHSCFFSSTPYPLQYDLIINRPTRSSLTPTRSQLTTKPNDSHNPEEAETAHNKDSTFDTWVDNKLTNEDTTTPLMDKSKRKYYNKRRKRMYGTDSDDDINNKDEGFIELKPQVVDFHRLHKREEELYFYDAFVDPWDKDKHYKMVYQLEKKYFPHQCLDKAFLQPGDVNANANANANANKKGKVLRSVRVSAKKSEVGGGEENDKKLVFFDESSNGDGVDSVKGDEPDVTEKKVSDFFKCLKKVPNKEGEVSSGEPYLVTRSTELPPKWDSPYGTVVLVNKPKGGEGKMVRVRLESLYLWSIKKITIWYLKTGWTSFTVCGKLRRLVNVKKVGHAGTLDPMATGLLIVCVGKATKLADSYQGMIKGYSGVFRLGEATSTWDADSPVIQREPWEHIKDADIKKAAASFFGEIWQVPPMFSAIKVGGEKMYDKARRGESIELAPRRISIFQFDIERSLEDRQNLIFRVVCSKGTYIRSLCADLGKALGSCAHLTALRRDSIGEYSADDAWEFKELEQAIAKNYF